MSEWLDEETGQYPSEAGIDRILNFRGSPRQFIDFLDEMWWPQEIPGMQLVKVTEHPGVYRDEPHFVLYMATGGWSGNEDIIGALKNTFFWMRYWYSSVRGGGFTFLIPEKNMDQDDGFMGHWKNYPKREEQDA